VNVLGGDRGLERPQEGVNGDVQKWTRWAGELGGGRCKEKKTCGGVKLDELNAQRSSSRRVVGGAGTRGF